MPPHPFEALSTLGAYVALGALDLAENALLARVPRRARAPYTHATAACAFVRGVLCVAGVVYSWLFLLALAPWLRALLAGRRRSPAAGAG